MSRTKFSVGRMMAKPGTTITRSDIVSIVEAVKAAKGDATEEEFVAACEELLNRLKAEKARKHEKHHRSR